MLVNVDADAVSQRVRKVLVEPVLGERASRDRVDLGARHARLRLFKHEVVRAEHACIRLLEFCMLMIVAEEEGPRLVRAIASHLAAEVDEHGIAEPELRVVRLVVRLGTVRTEATDRVERRLACAALTHMELQQSRRLALRHALSQLAFELLQRFFRDVARPLNAGELLCGLDRHRLRDRGGDLLGDAVGIFASGARRRACGLGVLRERIGHYFRPRPRALPQDAQGRHDGNHRLGHYGDDLPYGDHALVDPVHDAIDVLLRGSGPALLRPGAHDRHSARRLFLRLRGGGHRLLSQRQA